MGSNFKFWPNFKWLVKFQMAVNSIIGILKSFSKAYDSKYPKYIFLTFMTYIVKKDFWGHFFIPEHYWSFSDNIGPLQPIINIGSLLHFLTFSGRGGGN